ncbi:MULTISPECIES: Stk1 family PASTA domain-containing Ser/Thr kinase [unclassified Streptomyces]|uniref:Stk1 family PASTA domain-containing Ser/Thr kinase n=1 Tax=unclassified Streptomyces TaxID=2593676 RepID=UPI002E2C7783|nr:Stk1 family PASTA domain-containing Ser/Thr kinase [Streptomyces sp. NBC_01429]
MEEARRLGGRYELGSVLGRGGMAEVYLAHDTRLGRSVAVKTLRADLARDPSFQARFRREAQSAASLNHPAIVAVYDTGEDYVDGVSLPYIVMEHVDGSTLRELLHSGRRLLPERTLEMTVGILQALEYSHRNGIVHRDIKPANVMLTRTGQVKVMDFGIARAMGDSGMTMTQTSAVIGTAQYLSPEQAKGEQVDARSDLYSTGCLLYELLTVRPPFIGDSPVAVAYQHVREEPQTPSVFDPEITPEMDAIVLKALVKDPDFRYQSADEMRADIEACLDGQPVAATAAMGAVGYGGYGGQDQQTAAMHQGNAGAPTSMLPPMNPDDGGYDGYDDRQGRRRGNQKKSNTSTILLAVAGILVLIGAILIGRALFSGDGNDPNPVDVPQVVGKTLKEAESMAENSHVKLEQIDSKRCEVPKGSICSQIPETGKINEGDTVQVVVSEGAPQVKVPDVTEKQKQSATDILEGEKFKVDTKEEESDSATPGTVLSQDPEAGKEVETGTTVTLTIAKQAKVSVPDVTGNALADAQSQLTILGFTVNPTQVDSDEPAGTVIKQSPSGNTKAEKGSQVSLEVSNGPKQDEQPEKVTIPNDGIKFSTVGAVRGMLEGLGLQVSVPENTPDGARVLDTDPGGGSELNKGDTVSLRVFGSQNGNGGDNGNGGNGNGGNNSGFIGGTG